MSVDPRPVQGAHRRLSPPALALSGVLILIPLVALAIVPVYARHKPVLWGFPFFYWYQLLWVFIAALCTWAAWRVVARDRRGDRR